METKRQRPASLRLIVSDGSAIETSIEAARLLPTLDGCIDDDSTEISIPLARREVERFVQWAEHHVDDPPAEGEPDAFDKALVSGLAPAEIIEIVIAWKWFGTPSHFLELIAWRLKNMSRDKSSAEICAALGVSETTKEEQRAAIESQPYALKGL
jgi:hypothetical protein